MDAIFILMTFGLWGVTVLMVSGLKMLHNAVEAAI
jgi:hypothetical protein